MTISKEERAKLRAECQTYCNVHSSTDYKITRLLDALEAAEARAEAAEKIYDQIVKPLEEKAMRKFAEVYWTVQDIFVRLDGKINEAEAEEILESIEIDLQDRMVSAAWALVDEAVRNHLENK